jgi:hypothetical protein
MTIKSGKNARPYRVSYVEHDLAKDIEITRFSIGDSYTAPDKMKRWVFIRVTVWENLPIVNGDLVRILYYYDFTIAEKLRRMPDKSVHGVVIYSMAAKVVKVDPAENEGKAVKDA